MIMIKYCFYFLFSLVLMVFVSCSANEPEYSMDGKWLVDKDDMRFVCSDASLQSRVGDRLLPNYLSKGDNNYIEFDSQRGTYKENLMEWKYTDYSPSGEPTDSIEVGVYVYEGKFEPGEKDDQALITITSFGDGNWSYVIDVVDLNSEFIYIKQEMNASDLKRFLQSYFSAIGSVPEGVTATWTRKAWRVK